MFKLVFIVENKERNREGRLKAPFSRDQLPPCLPFRYFLACLFRKKDVLK